MNLQTEMINYYDLISHASSLEQTFVEGVAAETQPVTLAAVMRVSLPENLSFFEGHFPSGPILPAVGILDLSLLLLRDVLARQNCLESSKSEFASWKELGVESINQLKVKAPIIPGEKYRVEITKAPTSPHVEFSWVDEKNNSMCADLKLSLKST